MNYFGTILKSNSAREAEIKIYKKAIRIIIGPVKVSNNEFRRRSDQEIQEIKEEIVKKMK